MRYMLDKVFEALKRIETVFPLNKEGKPNVYKEYSNSVEPFYNDFDLVFNALTELKQIKESKPSEAMECLERVWWDIRVENNFRDDFKDLLVIRKVLLKARKDNTTLKLAVDFANEVGKKLHLTDMDEMLERIEKLEKAKEIIKKKCSSGNSNLWLVSCLPNYERYIAYVNDTTNHDHDLVRAEHNELTEEEFDLLKEITNND